MYHTGASLHRIRFEATLIGGLEENRHETPYIGRQKEVGEERNSSDISGLCFKAQD